MKTFLRSFCLGFSFTMVLLTGYWLGKEGKKGKEGKDAKKED